MPVKTIDKLYKEKLASMNNIEYLSEVPGMTVNRMVNKLFANGENYWHYRLIEKPGPV